MLYVVEERVADLSSVNLIAAAGLDPDDFFSKSFQGSWKIAQDLKEAGYSGLLTPSAALPGTGNLTLFGERFEVAVGIDPAKWKNPRPAGLIPSQKVAENAQIPEKLLASVSFATSAAG